MERSASNNTSNDSQDDDDWSQKVQTDDSARLPLDQPSSLAAHHGGLASPMVTMPPTPPPNRGAAQDLDLIDTGSVTSASLHVGTGLAPERPEPTLKERLVERERQRRVETERARLKRQFALSGNTGESIDDDDDGTGNGALGEKSSAVGEDGPELSQQNGSVQGTAGDDSSVDMQDENDHDRGNDNDIGNRGDEDNKEATETKLTYPMERFLQEQGAATESQDAETKEQPEPLEQKVVMERFLHDPVVIATPEPRYTAELRPPVIDRSVSFDIEPPQTPEPSHMIDVSEGQMISQPPIENEKGLVGENRGYFGSASTDVASSVASMEVNASVDANVSVGDDMMEIVDNEVLPPDHSIQVSSGARPDSPSSIDQSPISEQPLVLRLTEAEIQQMAAIDEASRSNAPPSERDSISESSFVGELTDFAGSNVDMAGNLSQGTPATVLDSYSILSGNQSAIPSTGGALDVQSLSGVSQHSRISSAGGNVSLTANPPSVTSPHQSPVPEEVGPVESLISNVIHSLHQLPCSEEKDDRPAALALHEAPSELTVGAAANEGIVNRTIRPGMINSDVQRRMARASNSRDIITAADNGGFVIDGFDFSKQDPISPGCGDLYDSFRDLPADDVWSTQGQMIVSPLDPNRKAPLSKSLLPSNVGAIPTPNYGSTTHFDDRISTVPELSQNNFEGFSVSGTEKHMNRELEPFLDVPTEIIAKRSRGSRVSIRTMDRASINMTIDDVFSDIRSQSTATVNAGAEEANEYMRTGVLERAFPERMSALVVTMLIEIPVLLMVSGGSDRLCQLIGRSKYQLLLGFLPLSSAISGNVGLQASTLTTRAISHGHVTRELYRPWLMKEVGAAVCLGLGMGFLLACIAFVFSDYSFPFAATIMLAQFVSILTAGVTGTFAPLVFSFIFNRDAGKWGGPLETAIQDIIGSFAMVVMSYKLLQMFGPYPIDPSEACG